MLKKNLEIAEFVAAHNIPTILAFDTKSNKYVIGNAAKSLASSFRPIVQDFKQAIGEADPMFEGRFLLTPRSAKPQRLWDVRPEATDSERYISTKEALKTYLQNFFGEIGGVPT